jgi:nickel/cobalt transporter (NiCoT) family protein
VRAVAEHPAFARILGATPYALRRGGIWLRLRSEDPQTVASECGTSQLGPAGTGRERICAMTHLNAAERRRLAGFGAVVFGLHAVGFFLLLALVVPHHFRLGEGGVFGLGLGFTAYALGLRHAFDADHISAIDNATRKLMADGKRPLGVGFFFSLGHSTVVFVLCVLCAIGLHAVTGEMRDGSSTLHDVAGLVGTSVSGLFLLLIAACNMAILAGIVRVVRGVRGGAFDETEIERQLERRGLMGRFYGRFTRAVGASWQMYPIGVLFGLGFDTATEVALLFLAAGAATSGLPFYAILCLPVLFAAGMSLLDTIDGSLMRFAYGWAFARPARRIYYNLVVTALSIAVALLVGSIELLSVLAAKLSLTGWVWEVISGLDLNAVGFVIVALFALTWVGAVAIWRLGRIEERWSATSSRR